MTAKTRDRVGNLANKIRGEVLERRGGFALRRGREERESYLRTSTDLVAISI